MISPEFSCLSDHQLDKTPRDTQAGGGLGEDQIMW